MQLEEDAINVTASDFILHVERAMSALQAERQKGSIAGGKVSGGLVEISELKGLAVIGDLHGDSKSLYRILSEINHEEFLSDPMNKLVFLGDYVDRGSDSVGVLFSICHLKKTYPGSIVLMRGNHEAPAEFPFSSHDLPYETERRFADRDKEVYYRLLSMFRLLALGVVIRQRLLLVHGGLPTEEIGLGSIAAGDQNQLKNRVLEEILWNDPRQLSEPGWEESRRGLGRHFGSSISRKWLQASNTKSIVRGHEPCQGFRLDHDDTVLTLFSCREAYPKFKAAYLMLDSGQLAAVTNARDLSNYVRFLR